MSQGKKWIVIWDELDFYCLEMTGKGELEKIIFRRSCCVGTWVCFSLHLTRRNSQVYKYIYTLYTLYTLHINYIMCYIFIYTSMYLYPFVSISISHTLVWNNFIKHFTSPKFLYFLYFIYYYIYFYNYNYIIFFIFLLYFIFFIFSLKFFKCSLYRLWLHC